MMPSLHMYFFALSLAQLLNAKEKGISAACGMVGRGESCQEASQSCLGSMNVAVMYCPSGATKQLLGIDV